MIFFSSSSICSKNLKISQLVCLNQNSISYLKICVILSFQIRFNTLILELVTTYSTHLLNPEKTVRTINNIILIYIFIDFLSSVIKKAAYLCSQGQYRHFCKNIFSEKNAKPVHTNTTTNII